MIKISIYISVDIATRLSYPPFEQKMFMHLHKYMKVLSDKNLVRYRRFELYH